MTTVEVAAVVPLSMLAGVNRFGAEQPDWPLCGPPTTGTNRRFVGQVRFERPFKTVPVVHLGLTGFDISNEDWARLEVRAGAIYAEGFEVIAETWYNTRVWSFRVSWLALG
jgi:hypothetical protein